MPSQHWVVPVEVQDLLSEIKERYHPCLQQASFAVEFVDSKPFVKDRMNLGKVTKFSKSAKLWHARRYDFAISICADVWATFLTAQQKAPLLDLHLSRCKAALEPQMVEVNGKQEKVKDEFGRVIYTNEMRLDDDGSPIWELRPLDIQVITENMLRFGPWYDDLAHLRAVVLNNE